ncbi:hypothetical protein [Nocardia sp. NPDC050710]|uniref:hypothetical protein n=1 Tax=Nocardia sp. NPDC050710 TaxID=3157220 RepID=UPI0033FD73DA
MTALFGRNRTRIAAVLTGTALAGAATAIVAGAASAQPFAPAPAGPGGPTVVCVIPGPGIDAHPAVPLPDVPGPHVRIERIAPGTVLPGCPPLGEHGLVTVRPAQPAATGSSGS